MRVFFFLFVDIVVSAASTTVAVAGTVGRVTVYRSFLYDLCTYTSESGSGIFLSMHSCFSHFFVYDFSFCRSGNAK